MAALLAAAAGCGGSDPPATTTVAGCTAATVDKILTGDLADTSGPDDPQCEGLSAADLMKAGADAFADREVKAHVADLLKEGDVTPGPPGRGAP